MVPVLILGFTMSLLFSDDLWSQEKQKKEAEKIFIPKEVKTVLLEGLEARQARLDIPFTVFKHIFLPASSGFHNVLFFKVKNASLGFAAPTPAKEEKKKEKEATPPAFEEQPATAQLEAKFNIFLMFNRLEKDTSPQIVREVYVPVSLQADPASFDPEKEEIYTFGFPTASGNYLLAMAITSLDLSKIGTYYFEFSIPDPATFAAALETTPIFFIKNMEQMAAPETRIGVHKDSFVYSVLKIEPHIDNVFAMGENLDIFFFILGTKPNEQQQYKEDIIVNKWNWSRTEDGSYIEVKGEIKNNSKKDLRDVEAVATFYDKDNKYITHSSALIEYNPILSSQTSPFRIIEKYNPAIANVNLEFKFLSGDKIASTNAPQYNIEVNYEVKQGDQTAIRYEATTYSNPLISQPLPLKQTVLVKTEKEEKKEVQDLPAGHYTLVITIADKISGLSAIKNVEFDVK
jgi:hypothetical protein